MSDRSLPLPDRAIAGLLNYFNASLTRAEKVAQWPGAVRFVERTTPLVLTGSMQEAVGMDLDAGSWLVYSGLVITSATSAPAVYGRLESPSNPGTSYIDDVHRPDASMAPTRRFSLPFAQRVSLNSMQIGGTATVRSAFLVALYV